MRLCLNMIVKDEAHVIEESLNLLKNYICYWVISDTGSTDNTKEIIKDFFKREKIPGNLIEHKWKDFGTNRTLALDACYKYRKHFDYIWVFDADDLIVGDLVFPKKPRADMYNLIYGQGFTYWRGQIFKSSLKWRYVGVLHEFPECASKQNPTRENINGDYYIDSRRIGNRNKAEDKYERDAKILEQGLIDEPDNVRYMFYLGQSYMDAKNYDKAIEWYTKRAERGGWIEEVYYSLYRVATCMQTKNMPWEEVEKAYMKAWKSLPSRIDPLYEIAKYYRVNNNFEKAYTYAKQASKIKYPTDQFLFLFQEIYEYKIWDELAIIAFYVGKYEESFETYNTLLKKDLSPFDRNRIENNRDMCIQHILNNYITYPVKQIIKIKNNKNKNNIVFTITTSNLDSFNKTINSFLNCCLDYYKIDKWICIIQSQEDNSQEDNTQKDKDNYLSEDDIDTMKKLYPLFEYNNNNNNNNNINNIVKDYKYWINMDSDWQYFEKRNYIEECIDVLLCDSSYGQVLFNKNYAEDISGRQLVGGILSYTQPQTQNKIKQRYIIHEYYPKNTPEYENFLQRNPGKSNRVYWPHYSVRPSMMKVSVILTVERVENENKLDYATRYTNMGYKSTFLDTICCHRIKYIKHKDNVTVDKFTELFKSDDIWIEIKGKDSYGYDLGPPISGDIDFMKSVALNDENCIGFNSLGYLKNMIVTPDKWIDIDYPGFTMYIHKTRYEEYYKIQSKSNSDNEKENNEKENNEKENNEKENNEKENNEKENNEKENNEKENNEKENNEKENNEKENNEKENNEKENNEKEIIVNKSLSSDSDEHSLYIDSYNFEEAYNLFDKINPNSLSSEDQFMFYDLLSTVYWNTWRKEEAIEICQHIIELAKTNLIFNNLVTLHYDRLNDKFNGFSKGQAITDYKGSVVIVGLGNIFGDWDPSSIKTGLPGSEEAIVYGARALADLGYRVVVYSLPPPKSIYSLKLSNPEYRRIETLNNDMILNKEHYDVAFIWRQYNIQHYTDYNLADKYLLWLHDLCYGRNVFQTIPPKTEILWLSEFHRSSFLPSNPILNQSNNYRKTYGNGIVPRQFLPFNTIRENKYSCIYSSNYARGLKILLDIWIEIKTKYPESTLDIYYGWQTWGTISPQEEEQLKVKVKQLEKYDVREHGQIGHEELAEKMKQTSFWTYPCTFEETFCITGIKAQAAGCIPVIVESAALLETVKYGYKTNDVNNYKQLLFDAFGKVDDWTANKREEMSKWAIENHSWKNVATKWIQEF
jgi:tetratricopeptide (TPR) repeat protein